MSDGPTPDGLHYHILMIPRASNIEEIRIAAISTGAMYFIITSNSFCRLKAEELLTSS